jgi:hypothetical protein
MVPPSVVVSIGAMTLLKGLDKATGRIPPNVEEAVMNEVRANFKPELLNRLDDIILFQPLSSRDLASIVHIQLRDLTKRLSEKEMTLQLTPQATDLILAASYVPAFGARPLRRYLEKHVTTAISKLLIEGRLRKRCTVVISAAPDGQSLAFDVVQPSPSNVSATSSSAENSPRGSPNPAAFKKSRTGDRRNVTPAAASSFYGRGSNKEEPDYMNE